MAGTQAVTNGSAPAVAAQPKTIIEDILDETEKLDVVMGKRWGIEPRNLIAYVRSHIGLWKGAPDGYQVPRPVVDQFLSVCREHGLHPAKKEFYGFYHPDKGLQCGVMIDGWITLANRQPSFDGWELSHERDEKGKLVAVTCKLWRRDRTRPTEVRVKLSEWRVGTNPNWQTREEWMLEIKAIKQGIRLAFGFGGLQDENDLDLIIEETERRQAARAEEPQGSKADKLARKLAAPIDDYGQATHTQGNGEGAERAHNPTSADGEANLVASPPPDGGGESRAVSDDGTAQGEPPPVEPDVLPGNTKLFVRMMGKKPISMKPSEMSDTDLHDAQEANEAALSDPTLKDDEKAHRLGVQQLLAAEFEKRGK